MKVLNFGSCNIDYVYELDRIVQPGETVSAAALSTHAGGKGLNQSIATARAGGEIYHAGNIGEDGEWLRELLAQSGADTEHLRQRDARTGHAMIQVDSTGENCIIVYAGANAMLDEAQIDEVLDRFSAGDLCMLQNETPYTAYIIKTASARGLRVLWNGPQKAVTVVMGRPSPLSGAGVRWQGEALTRLSVGNPHGVLFCPDIEHFPLAQAAAEIARTARLNLEAVQILEKNHLKMRVWERGSGETLACGTGACAAATAAVLKKHCERGQPITVEMPGGTVTVRWLTDGRLLLTGEAEFVFRGEWPEDPEPC